MNEKQTDSANPTDTTVRPTKKQRELLEYISQFIAENGYSPSYREIMNGLQYTSVATVALHVGNLIKRGHLQKRDHHARSLEVVASTTADVPLRTNEVKETDEKWLTQKVENLFKEAESQALPTPTQVEDLKVMLAALRVLGLEGAAQSFQARLAGLSSAIRT